MGEEADQCNLAKDIFPEGKSGGFDKLSEHATIFPPHPGPLPACEGEAVQARTLSHWLMFAQLRNWFERKSPNHLRQTRYEFDGETIMADGPFARRISVKLQDIHEIGIETTDAGPFVEDVFWLINRDTDGLRIPQQSPVFQALMENFGALQGFDWQPFTQAMSCTDCRYFLCWRRRT